MIRTTALVFAVLLGLGSGAQALNLTVGDVSVQNLSSFGFEANTGANVLSIDGGTDELYQLYGYLGNANGTVAVTGAAFTPTTAITQIAPDQAQSVLSLNGGSALGLGPADGAISIQYDWLLFDDTSPADFDHVRWTVDITNNTAATQDLVFYVYLDLDLEGAADFADDTAFVTANKSTVTVGDASDPTRTIYWQSSSQPFDHFQVGAYPTIRDLLDGMGAAGNLSDNLPVGTTFGPGDFTAAFQFNFQLAPGASFNLVQVVPEPGLAALAAVLGLAVFPKLVRSRG